MATRLLRDVADNGGYFMMKMIIVVKAIPMMVVGILMQPMMTLTISLLCCR